MLEKDLRSLLYNCRGTIPSATDLLLFRAEGTFYFDKQTLSRLRCPLLAPPLLSPSRTIESIEETVDFIGWANKILAMIPEKRYLYHVNSSPVEIKMFSCAPPSPKEEVVPFFYPQANPLYRALGRVYALGFYPTSPEQTLLRIRDRGNKRDLETV